MDETDAQAFRLNAKCNCIRGISRHCIFSLVRGCADERSHNPMILRGCGVRASRAEPQFLNTPDFLNAYTMQKLVVIGVRGALGALRPRQTHRLRSTEIYRLDGGCGSHRV